MEKVRCKNAADFLAINLERREVEKGVFLQKEADHGFRNLSVNTIPPGFEHQITKLKTKCDKIMNSHQRGKPGLP
jgi:hypothetical protein